MSAGTENYEDAQEFIAHLRPQYLASDADVIALAQVRATLALVEVTALNIRRNGILADGTVTVTERWHALLFPHEPPPRLRTGTRAATRDGVPLWQHTCGLVSARPSAPSISDELCDPSCRDVTPWAPLKVDVL